MGALLLADAPNIFEEFPDEVEDGPQQNCINRAKIKAVKKSDSIPHIVTPLLLREDGGCLVLERRQTGNLFAEGYNLSGHIREDFTGCGNLRR